MLNVIEAINVEKSYSVGGSRLSVLKDVSLSVGAGEVVALLGPSGSGKSTLMDILGLLAEPDNGEICILGHPAPFGDDTKLTALRGHSIGFVFQAFHLLPRLTAVENVALPLFYAGVPKVERLAAAVKAMNALGIGPRACHYPNQMSGGEKQRVAIARAVVADPAIILADEPTGNLDSASASVVMDILMQMADSGRGVLVVTHDEDVATKANRTVRIRDGCVVSVVARRKTGKSAGVAPAVHA